MSDVFTKAKRSEVMSRIRGRAFVEIFQRQARKSDFYWEGSFGGDRLVC